MCVCEIFSIAYAHQVTCNNIPHDLKYLCTSSPKTTVDSLISVFHLCTGAGIIAVLPNTKINIISKWEQIVNTEGCGYGAYLITSTFSGNI